MSDAKTKILQKVVNAFLEKERLNIVYKPIELKTLRGGYITNYVSVTDDGIRYVYFEITLNEEKKKEWVSLEKLILHEKDALVNFILWTHDFGLADMLIELKLWEI